MRIQLAKPLEKLLGSGRPERRTGLPPQADRAGVTRSHQNHRFVNRLLELSLSVAPGGLRRGDILTVLAKCIPRRRVVTRWGVVKSARARESFAFRPVWNRPDPFRMVARGFACRRGTAAREQRILIPSPRTVPILNTPPGQPFAYTSPTVRRPCVFIRPYIRKTLRSFTLLFRKYRI
jgi:hypothetical protein